VNLSTNLESNLKSINVAFSKLVHHIGYVEPKNMKTYRETTVPFLSAYVMLDKIVGNTSKIVLKFIAATDKKKANIQNIYTKIQSEVTDLRNYDTKVTSTYNYKSSNVDNKRNPIELPSSGPSYNNGGEE
jgi:hypothetical protein